MCEYMVDHVVKIPSSLQMVISRLDIAYFEVSQDGLLGYKRKGQDM